MPYELTFDKRLHYLYAEIHALETNVTTALEYWQTIITKCREFESNRLLVRQDIPGGLSTGEMFALASEVSAMDAPGIKIAFVDPDLENFEGHRFAELVAGNRGLWAKVFTTVPEAESWLVPGITGTSSA
jgi:hypothetical protein